MTAILLRIGCEPGSEHCGPGCNMEGDASWCRAFERCLIYDVVKNQHKRCEACKIAEEAAKKAA
jgi:hypothetical protein